MNSKIKKSKARTCIHISPRAFEVINELGQGCLSFAKIVDYLLVKTGHMDADGKDLEYQAIERFLYGKID